MLLAVRPLVGRFKMLRRFCIFLISILFGRSLSIVLSLAYICLRCLEHFFVVMQIGQKFSKPPADDMFYEKTRSMLTNLGLQNYEKNFKRGLLTDNTLPLLNDRQVIRFPLILFSFERFYLNLYSE